MSPLGDIEYLCWRLVELAKQTSEGVAFWGWGVHVEGGFVVYTLREKKIFCLQDDYFGRENCPFNPQSRLQWTAISNFVAWSERAKLDIFRHHS